MICRRMLKVLGLVTVVVLVLGSGALNVLAQPVISIT
jgi:hypothetical protein